MKSTSNNPECTTTCLSFRCSKRMLKIIKKGSEKQYYCTMDDFDCIGSMCRYATCNEKKLSDNGKCLKQTPAVLKAKQTKAPSVSPYEYSENTNTNLNDRLQKKLHRKVKQL